jgi:N-acylneuraminate cytidylyltransferase
VIAAVIPARGGSKRLPGKNLRPFCNRPLLYYSVAVCQRVEAIDRYYVSTEDPEIAALARGYGAEVIERPAALATDDASTASVIAHAARHIVAQGLDPSAIVTLQPTNPLRPPALVSQAIDAFKGAKCDSLVSVSPSKAKIGRIENGLFAPDYVLGLRSQDFPAQYRENGLIYITRLALLTEQDDLFGRSLHPFVVEPPFDRVDIDDSDDLIMAEALYARYSSDLGY